MFTKILNAYHEFGYDVYLGTNHARSVILTKQQQIMFTGGGMLATDALFFSILGHYFTPNSIFIVGNAFGYSAFVLSHLFPDAIVDVIDAEIEGRDNKAGSKLTHEIANKHYPNVQLTIGFSPMDLNKAMRCPKYDLFFIDGLHTNDQLWKDWVGCEQRSSDSCVFYLHDVEFFKMNDAYNKILSNYQWMGYNVDFTEAGCKAIVKHNDLVQKWLETIQCPIAELRNYSESITIGLKDKSRQPREAFLFV